LGAAQEPSVAIIWIPRLSIYLRVCCGADEELTGNFDVVVSDCALAAEVVGVEVSAEDDVVFFFRRGTSRFALLLAVVEVSEALCAVMIVVVGRLEVVGDMIGEEMVATVAVAGRECKSGCAIEYEWPPICRATCGPSVRLETLPAAFADSTIS